MGCPDWPRCFGSWVPPTRVDQLPADYKEQYAALRDRKNQKFASYLSLLGLDDTAQRIREDPSIRVENDFNVSKTWVEYVNRLVGVFIGILIIGLFLVSWRTRQAAPRLFSGSLLLLILVIFQGWFGSIVVSTNLTQWTITVHMFLAIMMVVLLAWLLVRSGDRVPKAPVSVRPWLVGAMAALLVQIFLGTQVREALDRLSATVQRENWIAMAGQDFLIHRSFSWVVILLLAGVYIQLRKTTSEKALYLVPFLLILCSVLTGLVMAYFAVPPAFQPLHLLVAVVSFGWLFQVYLQSNKARETVLIE